MATPEQARGPEHGGAEVAKQAAERAAEIGHNQSEKEKPHERSERAEKARAEALEQAQAISGVERSPAESERQAPAGEPATVSKKKQEDSFKQTMRHAQAQLSAPERTFSKVIHHPVVERTSEALGKTVARPNAVLSGSLFAFVAVLGLYITARYLGFELSGSETIVAFLVGWLFGLLFDLVRSAFGKS